MLKNHPMVFQKIPRKRRSPSWGISFHQGVESWDEYHRGTLNWRWGSIERFLLDWDPARLNKKKATKPYDRTEYICNYIIWLVVQPPLSKILVNWDDYSQYMGKYKMFQTTNQQNIYICIYVIIYLGWVCVCLKQGRPSQRLISARKMMTTSRAAQHVQTNANGFIQNCLGLGFIYSKRTRRI